jgi:hypothetical protein
MTTATPSPAIVRSGAPARSIRVEPLTCAIGAELSNVNLGVASRDPGLVAEIRALLLKHRVLFFRDQDISRAEHVAFARHFGELEDHPVAGSDPDHPGLVRIYKSPETPNENVMVSTSKGTGASLPSTSSPTAVGRWASGSAFSSGSISQLPIRADKGGIPNDLFLRRKRLRRILFNGYIQRSKAGEWGRAIVLGI